MTPERSAGRRLPPLAIRRGPDAIEVSGLPADATIGEIAVAIGISADARAPVAVDGSVVAGSVPAARSGLRRGSVVSSADSVSPPPAGAAEHCAGIDVVCLAGPAAGGRWHLGNGRHVLGRASSCGVRISDPLIEPHHLLLDVAGSAAVCSHLGGHPAISAGSALSPTRHPLTAGTLVEVGASLLRVEACRGADGAPGAGALTLPTDPWRRALHRSPQPPTGAATVSVEAPGAPGDDGQGAAGGLVPSLVGIAAAATLALIVDQPMFLLFGLVGAAVGIAGWGSSRIGRWRRRRRARSEHQADLERFAAAMAAANTRTRTAHERANPDLARWLQLVGGDSSALWRQRREDSDAFTVGLGIGDLPASIQVVQSGSDRGVDPSWEPVANDHRTHHDVVVPLRLGPGRSVGLVGERCATASLCRSLVVQLAAASGPADWALVVAVEDPDSWQWAAWLPQVTAGGIVAVESEADIAALATDGLPDGVHVVVVTDRPSALSRRTGALRRLCDERRACVLSLAGALGDLAASTRTVVHIGARWRAKLVVDGAVGALPVSVHTAGLGAAAALDAAAHLGGLVDPDESGGGGVLPHDVGLLEIVPVATDAGQLVRLWSSSRASGRLVATLGVAADGVVEVDLDRDGPHLLVGGTTGSGKSELLRTFVASLALHASPEDVTFVLVDYKGGATFDACVELPHVVGVVTDLDERLAERALRSLDAELRRRERVLRSLGASDLSAARSTATPGSGVVVPARLVIVVDEFATLAAEHAEFLRSLVGIAQRGRSLGVHLVLATQRPAGVVSDDIRANTSVRIALRVHDAADSTDVVGSPVAAQLPRRCPGRAVIRLGVDEVIEIQAARVSRPVEHDRRIAVRSLQSAWAAPAVAATTSADGTDDEPTVATPSELELIAAVARRAARRAGCAAPYPPWRPPLPTVLSGDELPSGAVGLCDIPEEQAQEPLVWDPRDGNLLLCGAPGTGTTSTVVSIVRRLAAVHSAAHLHVYVVDGHGDAALGALGALPHCGAIVQLHEYERVRRLLSHAADVLERRRRGAAGDTSTSEPVVLLVVDGIDALRATLDDDLAATGVRGVWDDLVADAGAHGVVVVGSVTTPSVLPAAMLGRFPHRWVFHLGDPYDAAVVGVAARDVPARIPGRCVVAARGVEAQLAPPPEPRPEQSHAAVVSREPCAPRIVERPHRIAVRSIPVDGRDDTTGAAPAEVMQPGLVELLLGVSFVTGDPVHLPVPSGAHLTVLGPSRSGRSTTLARIAHAWADHPGSGPVHVVAPRASPLRAGGWHARHDVAAELVDELVASSGALLVVDDADALDDPDGALAGALARPGRSFTVAMAARADSLRSHAVGWTGHVRRSRRGVVLTGGSDLDGDVVGVVLPRRLPSPAPPGLVRPGLAWVIGDGEPVLTQLAVDDGPATEDPARR